MTTLSPTRILIVLLCFFTSQTIAQNPKFEWATHVGAPNQNEAGEELVADVDGNVYICGYFSGTFDFDPGPGVVNLTSAGSDDIFVKKLDKDGKLVWVRRFGSNSVDRAHAIDIDEDNNIYISGCYTDGANFNPGGAGGVMSVFGGTDVFVLKLDKNGAFQWVKQIGGSFIEDSFTLAVGANKELYVGVEFQATIDCDPATGSTALLTGAGSLDIAFVKLKTDGTFQWARQIGNHNEERTLGIDTDKDGNMYATGYFIHGGDFDPDPIGVHNLQGNSLTRSDWFVLKLDQSGAFKWAHGFGDDINDIGSDIVVQPSGEVHVVGNMAGFIDLDPGNGNLIIGTGGERDVFHQKFDTNGNLLWAYIIDDAGDHQSPPCIATDKDGNTYIQGVFDGTRDFDPGLGGGALLTAVGSFDLFIQKINAKGHFVWAVNYGGNSTHTEPADIAVDSTLKTNVFTTGATAYSDDFDPTQGVFPLNANVITSDVYVHKLSQCYATQLNPKFSWKIICNDDQEPILWVTGADILDQPECTNPYSQFQLYEYDPNGIDPDIERDVIWHFQQGGSFPYNYNPGPFAFSYVLQPGKYYYVKHGVWDECNQWVEDREYNIKAPDPIQFNTGFNFSWDHDLNTLQPLLVVEGQSQPAGTNPYHQFNLLLQDPQGINAPTLEQTFAWWQQPTNVTPVYMYKEGPFTFPIPLVSGQTYTIQRGCWDDCNSWQATSVENIVAPVCDPAVLCNPSIYEYRFACFDMCGNNRWLADFAIDAGDPCFNAITKVEYTTIGNHHFGNNQVFTTMVPPFILPYCTSGPFNVTAKIYYGNHPTPLIRGYYAPKCQTQGKPIWTNDPGNNGVSDNAGGVGNGNGQNNAGGNGNGNGNGGNNGNGNGNGGGNNGNGNGNGGGLADNGPTNVTRSVSVHPNPTSTTIRVDMEGNPALIEVVDMPGQILLTSSQKTIDVSSLDRNMYFIRVHYPDGTLVTRKFIKH